MHLLEEYTVPWHNVEALIMVCEKDEFNLFALLGVARRSGNAQLGHTVNRYSYKCLASMLADKWGTSYSQTMGWLRLSFHCYAPLSNAPEEHDPIMGML